MSTPSSNNVKSGTSAVLDRMAGRNATRIIGQEARSAGHSQAQLKPASDSVVEGIDKHPAMMAAWAAMPIAIGVSKIGGAFGWVGDKLPLIGAPFRGMRTLLSAPADLLRAPLPNAASEVLYGKVRSTHLVQAGRAHKQSLGALKDVERELKGGRFRGRIPLVRTDTPEFEELHEVMDGIKERFGGVIEAKSEEVTMPHRPLEFIERAKSFDAAAEWKKFDDVAAPLEANLRAANNQKGLKQLAAARKQFDKFVTGVDTLKVKAGDAESAVRSALTNVESLAEKENKTTSRVVAYTSEKLGQFSNTVNNSMESGLLKPVGRARNKIVEVLERQVSKLPADSRMARVSAAAATALKESGANLSALPGKLAATPLHEHVYGGLWGLSEIASGVGVVKAFTTPAAAAEHMYAGVTGRHASLRQIQTDNHLPESLKELRGQYWRAAAGNAFTNLAAMAVNYKYMRPGSKSAGLAALPMMVLIQGAASAVGALMTPKNDLIQTYRLYTEAKQAGAEVPKTAAAALLVAAMPKLGKLELNNKPLLTVSQRYVDEGLTAAQILQTIDTGRFKKDFDEASKAVAASPQAKLPEGEQAKLKAEIDEGSKKLTVADGEMKDIDRRSAAANAKLENADTAKPVYGSFSAKAAAENRGARVLAPSATHAETLQKKTAEQEAVTARA